MERDPIPRWTVYREKERERERAGGDERSVYVNGREEGEGKAYSYSFFQPRSQDGGRWPSGAADGRGR